MNAKAKLSKLKSIINNSESENAMFLKQITLDMVRKKVKAFLGEDVSLVDKLIEERREDAKNE